jgi:hypothetical protein
MTATGVEARGSRAAGHRESCAPPSGPAGLTVARGRACCGCRADGTSDQGDRGAGFVILAEDGRNHIEHIYAKIGRVDPAGPPSLFAMQHGLCRRRGFAAAAAALKMGRLYLTISAERPHLRFRYLGPDE